MGTSEILVSAPAGTVRFSGQDVLQGFIMIQRKQ